MAQLIGRERELTTALGIVREAQAVPVARLVWVEGGAGLGKSALGSSVATAASDQFDGLVARVNAHRIQQGIRFAAIRNLSATVASALGGALGPYVAGLGAPADAPNPGEYLLRVLEGVTLDRTVLLIVDDVQWSDDDSLRSLQTIMSSLADRPLILFVLERTGEDLARHYPLERDRTIVLEPLRKQFALELAKAVFPGAANDVHQAIVDHAEGIPLDIISLAEEARDNEAADAKDVAMNMRSVVGRQIRELPAGERDFLQLMSLLSEPIQYALLRHLWSDDAQLVDLIAKTSGRYLIQAGETLQFRHALIADAILETIPVKIPMHRRIIAALQKVDDPTIEDRFQLADQALASGDRRLAQGTFTALAREASESGNAFLTVEAASRALEIDEPEDDHFVALYLAYGRALHFMANQQKAEDVLRHALHEADRRRITDIGPLVSQLILAQWFGDDHEQALRTYQQYAGELTNPADLAQLHGAALWFAVSDASADRVEEIARELESLNVTLPPEVSMRIEIARSYVALRTGADEQIAPALDRIDALARKERSSIQNLSDFARMFVDFSRLGTTYSRFEDFRKSYAEHANPFIDYMIALTHLYSGNYNAASIAVRNALSTIVAPEERRRILSVAAGLGTMLHESGEETPLIEIEVSRLLKGERQTLLLPIASWHIADPNVDETRVRVLSRIVMEALRTPHDPFVYIPLTPVCSAAVRTHDREVLGVISGGESLWRDQTPLVAAERMLAQSRAAVALKSPGAEARFAEAKSLALNLGLNALVELAERSMVARVDEQGSRSPLTRRERQISELISQGNTNKEIAELLVLSERTIEGHVANVFNKLGVSSRTQVAAWMIRATTAS